MRSTLFVFMILAALTAFAGPAAIFSGSDVKVLKQNIDLNGQSKILSGTVDPSSVATSAPIGSIYLNSSTGTAYRKLDAGATTNWLNLGIGSVSQAFAAGSLRITGCSAWVRNSATFGGFGTTTGCSYVATGNVLAPTTMVPGFRVQNMAAGTYMFVVRAEVIQTTTTVNAGVSIRFTDGTNTFSEQTAGDVASAQGQATVAGVFNGSYTYATAQPTTAFEIQEKNSAGSVTLSVGNGYNLAPAIDAMTVDVYYFPSVAQTVIQPALTPAYAGKQWNGTSSVNPQVGQSIAPSNTRTILSDASLATYTLLGSASNDASTNFQVTATLPAGEYEADFAGLLRVSSNPAGTNTGCVYELYDSIGAVVLGSLYVTAPTQAGAVLQEHSYVKGYFKLTGTTTKTIYLRAAKTAGDSTAGSYCATHISNATADFSQAMLTITPRTQSLPMPVIANSVVTGNAGVYRVESLNGTCANGGSATINSASTPSWATLGNQAASTCRLTIAGGIFSAQPYCVSTISASGGNGWTINQNQISANVIDLYGMSGGAVTAFTWSFNMLCMGPK